MKIDIRKTAIERPLLITPERFGDARGFFSETYNAEDLAAAGVRLSFVQDNHSQSAERGTVRGPHFQALPKAQTKLIRVPKGRDKSTWSSTPRPIPRSTTPSPNRGLRFW